MWRRNLVFRCAAAVTTTTVPLGELSPLLTPQNLKGDKFNEDISRALAKEVKDRHFYSQYWLPVDDINYLGLNVEKDAFFYRALAKDGEALALVNAQQTTDPALIAAVANRTQLRDADSSPSAEKVDNAKFQADENYYKLYKPKSMDGYARRAGSADLKAAAMMHKLRSEVWITEKQALSRNVSIQPSAVGVKVTRTVKSGPTKGLNVDILYNAEHTSNPAEFKVVPQPGRGTRPKEDTATGMLSAFGFVHKEPLAGLLRKAYEEKGYTSRFWLTRKQVSEAGTRVKPGEVGVEFEYKGHPVIYYNAHQLVDPKVIDAALTVQETIPPTTANSQMEEATQDEKPVEKGKGSPTPVALKGVCGFPLRSDVAAEVHAALTRASPWKELVAAGQANPEDQLSPYWTTAYQAAIHGVEVIPNAPSIVVPSYNTARTHGSGVGDPAEGVMYNAAHTTDPSVFTYESTRRSNFLEKQKNFEDAFPLDLQGKKHSSIEAGLKMASAATEYQFQSRYWITEEEAEAFGVAVYPNPCVVAAVPAWAQKKGKNSFTELYINADETTDPSVFNDANCQPFIPVNGDGQSWPPPVRRALQREHFEQHFQSPVYFNSEELEARGRQLRSDDERGSKVTTRASDGSPTTIVLYNEEQTVAKTKK